MAASDSKIVDSRMPTRLALRKMAKRKKVDVEQLLRERLKELGAIGGKATAKKLSKNERAEKAKKAAAARWGKKGK